MSCRAVRKLLGWLLFAGLCGASAAVAADEREQGVDVRLYQLDGRTSNVPDIVPGQLPNVHQRVEQFDLLDTRGDFKPLEDNFVSILTCQLTAPTEGEYGFRLTSDDGSLLYLNGTLVLVHDGPHGPEPKDVSLYLEAKPYEVEVRHGEIGGGAVVKLEWRLPGTQAFVALPTAAMTIPKGIDRKTDGGNKKFTDRQAATPGVEGPLDGLHPAYTLLNLAPQDWHPRVTGLALARGGQVAVATGPGGTEQFLVALDGSGKPAARPSAAALTSAPRWKFAGTALWQVGEGGKLVAAMPAGEIAAAPTDVAQLPSGPYAGQLLVGDRVYGGLRRVALESVGTTLQGTVFRFTQGLPAGVSQVLALSDGALVLGGDIGQVGRRPDMLVLLSPKAEPAFDILQVQARTNGLEVQFTKPLGQRVGWDVVPYRASARELGRDGAPQGESTKLAVKSASVAPDRQSVFLEIPQLQSGTVVTLTLSSGFHSEAGDSLWSRIAWVTLKTLGEQPGKVLEPPPGLRPNTLLADEQAAGWKLLFDGTTTANWRGFRQQTFPAKGWEVADGCLHLGPAGGGDLMTDQAFENFELSLEWNASRGANSGVMFRVTEDVVPSWHAGPEIQILDDYGANTAPDNIHSAGALYELYAPPKDKGLRPAGEFNELRLIVNGQHVEQWLNGRKIAEYDIGSDDWNARVAKSKFKGLPRFGTERKGHLLLQDHGYELWFRSIKIHELP